jgi:hypothetical protein
MKKTAQGAVFAGRPFRSRTRGERSARVEEEVGVETVELDHDPRRDGEPDGGEDRGSGEEFLHGWGIGEGDDGEGADGGPQLQRGDTVTLLSDSSSLPLVYSPKAARGQVAAARVLLNARGRSI